MFRLTLNEIDLETDNIEKIVNPSTSLFNGLESFEVVDSSKSRCKLGVFLGLFKNMKNLKRLLLKTQDRNINTLLGEFLHEMPELEELYLTSTASRSTVRLQIIQSANPSIRKLSVASQFVEEAKEIFGGRVHIARLSIDF